MSKFILNVVAFGWLTVWASHTDAFKGIRDLVKANATVVAAASKSKPMSDDPQWKNWTAPTPGQKIR